MKNKMIRTMLLCAAGLMCCACAQGSGAIDTSQYNDPPESEWVYTLDVAWQWNTGDFDESPGYVMSQEGIIEEGSREDPNAQEDEDAIIDDDFISGGRFYYFRGAAPGDVTLTMQTKNGNKLLDERTYMIRVYDDLRLAVLDVVNENSYR